MKKRGLARFFFLLDALDLVLDLVVHLLEALDLLLVRLPVALWLLFFWVVREREGERLRLLFCWAGVAPSVSLAHTLDSKKAKKTYAAVGLQEGGHELAERVGVEVHHALGHLRVLC